MTYKVSVNFFLTNCSVSCTLIGLQTISLDALVCQSICR